MVLFLFFTSSGDGFRGWTAFTFGFCCKLKKNKCYHTRELKKIVGLLLMVELSSGTLIVFREKG
jgi:hypothetical protein